MKIKLTFYKSIIAAFFLFLLSCTFAVKANAAPKIFFDPSPVVLPNGVDTEIKLQIDAESNSVFGADAVINFPSNDLTITSVTNGGFFSDFSYAPSSGKLEIHGFFGNSFDSRSGTGIFAIIKAKSNKDSGTGQMNFTCGSGSETEILRASDGQNILSCSSLSALTLNYAAANGNNSNNGNNNNNGGTTSDPNATNACGGTCGSNYNCNSGLFCNSGFCRNPDCPTSLTCGCTATARPTTKASVAPKSSIKPTPQVVMLTKYTPPPSALPTASAEPNSITEDGKNVDLKTISIWGVAVLALFSLIFGLTKLFKKSNNPPQITPPNEGGSQTTENPVQTYPVNTPTPPTAPPSTSSF